MSVLDFAVYSAEGERLGFVQARTIHEARGRGRALALRMGRPIAGVRVEPARRPPPPIVPRLPRRMVARRDDCPAGIRTEGDEHMTAKKADWEAQPWDLDVTESYIGGAAPPPPPPAPRTPRSDEREWWERRFSEYEWDRT